LSVFTTSDFTSTWHLPYCSNLLSVSQAERDQDDAKFDDVRNLTGQRVLQNVCRQRETGVNRKMLWHLPCPPITNNENGQRQGKADKFRKVAGLWKCLHEYFR